MEISFNYINSKDVKMIKSKSPRIIQFKGFSKSGKTTIIESLIKYLKKKNFTVSSIKSIHIDDFSIDKPGKNTWRMMEAGADPIVASSKNETAFIIKEKLSLDSIININGYISNEIKNTKMNQLDFILAEGFWECKYPLVLTLKTKNDLPKLLQMITKNTNYEEIIKNIFCFSGVYISEMENKHHFNLIDENLKYIISQAKIMI